MSETETETSAFPERRFEGRKIIYTDYEEVTDDNIKRSFRQFFIYSQTYRNGM